MKQNYKKIAWLLFALLPSATVAQDLPTLHKKVIDSATEILELYQASYAFGGHQLGSENECLACNACIAAASPGPRRQIEVCPSCRQCSLDCSHFTNLVFRRAGLAQPYLQTSLMIDLPASQLLRRYNLVDLQTRLHLAQPGDLLVYRGHVVLLKNITETTGDIIHATSGRELRGPGQGIQRERQVALKHYRGSLLRILRHKDLHEAMVATRLRPVTNLPKN